MSNAVAALAARRAGCPYIIIPHGVYEPGIRKMLKPPYRLREIVERTILEHAAAIHVFFESEGPIIQRLAPRMPPLIVAPIGFDVGEARWTGGGGYLAWMGRYDPTHKGLDVLVGAVALLEPDERPVVELRGPDFNGGFARTREQIERLGLGKWIHAQGPVAGDEKADFLARSNGYVMPSRWEGYGIALVENLAIGAPCLVSAVIHIAGPLADSRCRDPRAPDRGGLGRRPAQPRGGGPGGAGRAGPGVRPFRVRVAGGRGDIPRRCRARYGAASGRQALTAARVPAPQRRRSEG